MDSFDIRLLRMDDSLTTEVTALLNSRLLDQELTVQRVRSYPETIPFGGAILGGLSVEGLYVYSDPQPAVST